MTIKFGKNGILDSSSALAPIQDAFGNPALHKKANTEFWAKELIYDDGTYRTLTFGQANSSGNPFNFSSVTVMFLSRPQTRVAFTDLGGWWSVSPRFLLMGDRSSGNTKVGPSISFDGGTTLVSGDPASQSKYMDSSWSWTSFAVGPDFSEMTLNGEVINTTTPTNHGVSVIANASSTFKIGSEATPRASEIACCLVFEGILTADTILNIQLGLVNPKDVPSLRGYYKMNEPTNITTCFDHSGRGNHLTYSTIEKRSFNPTNILHDPTLTNTSIWTGSANISLSGNKIVLNTPAISGSFGTTCHGIVPSGVYQVTFTVSDYVSGMVRILLYSWNKEWNVATPSVSGNGTYSYKVKVSASGGSYSSNVRVQAMSSDANMKVSDIKVQPLSSFGIQSSSMPYVSKKQYPTTPFDRSPQKKFEADKQISYYGNAHTSVSYNALMNITGDFTVAGWAKIVKKRNLFGNINILVLGYSNGAAPIIIAYGDSGNNYPKIVVTLGNGTVSTGFDFYQTNIPFQTWFHYTVVRTGTNLSLWINGVLIETKTSVTTATASVGTGWSLSDDSNNSMLKSRSIRVLSRAVSSSEIEEMFSKDILSNRSNLILECMMNRADAHCADTSGNNLTINAGSSVSRDLDSPYFLHRPKLLGYSLRGMNSGSYFIDTNKAKNLLQSSVWSYTCWIKPTIYHKNQQIRLPYIAGLTTSGGLKVSVESSQIYVTLNTGTDVYGIYVNAGIVGNCWNLVGVEVNWITKTYKIYINGVFLFSQTQASLSGTAPDLSSNTTITFLRSGGATRSGELKNFRFYNRSLSDTEHRSAFLNKRITEGLQIEYTFDNDLNSSMIVDSSGNNLHSDWVGITSTDYRKIP